MKVSEVKPSPENYGYFLVFKKSICPDSDPGIIPTELLPRAPVELKQAKAEPVPEIMDTPSYLRKAFARRVTPGLDLENSCQGPQLNESNQRQNQSRKLWIHPRI
jgi:hypothetical protein